MTSHRDKYNKGKHDFNLVDQHKTLEFSYQRCDEGIEVVLVITSFGPSMSERRLALCTHEQDADDIVKALSYAYQAGIV